MPLLCGYNYHHHDSWGPHDYGRMSPGMGGRWCARMLLVRNSNDRTLLAGGLGVLRGTGAPYLLIPLCLPLIHFLFLIIPFQGGFLAEPKTPEQLEFVSSVAYIEETYTGILPTHTFYVCSTLQYNTPCVYSRNPSVVRWPVGHGSRGGVGVAGGMGQ